MDPDRLDPREIQFIVSEDVSDSEENTLQRQETQMHISKTLRDAGLAANSFWDDDRVSKISDWLVTKDDSVQAVHPEYDFAPVEMNSPPFFYCREVLLNVSAVSQVLTTTYRLHCNETCGLHVHIGNREDGFHPSILSNLFALLWTFEERLALLHPEERRSDPIIQHCRSLRNDSRLGRSLPLTPEGTRQGLKKLIELRDQNTCERIVTSMGTNNMDRLAYNIKNLDEVKCDPKMTVEFRQHEGTLSVERTIHWINVCAGLVEFAEMADPNELDEFLWSHIDDKNEDYTAIDLLRAIGRPAEADFYARTSELSPSPEM